MPKPLLRRSFEAHAFTLVELLIVVAILGIILAAAAPSFLGQTDKARESVAKQNLTVAYKSAKAATITETNQGSWGTAGNLAAAIAASEPQFTAVEADDGSYAVGEIDVSIDGTELALRTLASADQLCLLTVAENGAPTPVVCGPLVTYASLVESVAVFYNHLEVGGNAGTVVPSVVGPDLDVTNDLLETGAGMAGSAGAASWLNQGSGENAWLETSTNVTIPRASWAFEFWYSSSGARAQTQRLVQFWQDSNNYIDLQVFSDSGQLNFSGRLGGASISDVYTIPSFSLNTPYHLIWSNDGANIYGGYTLRLYLNGVLVATKETTALGSGSSSMSGRVAIGAEVTQAIDGAWHQQPWGRLDEVSVQDQSVSGATALSRYEAGS